LSSKKKGRPPAKVTKSACEQGRGERRETDGSQEYGKRLLWGERGEGHEKRRPPKDRVEKRLTRKDQKTTGGKIV